MATSNLDPIFAPDVSAQQNQIAQQQAIAQALMQQGMQDTGRTQMAGNVAIRNSPIAGLGNMLAAYLGGKMMNNTRQQQTDLARAQSQRTLDMFNNGTLSMPGSNNPQSDAALYASDPAAYTKHMLDIRYPEAKALPSDMQIFQWLQTQPQAVQDAYTKYKQSAQKPENPYYSFLPTSSGYAVGNNRTGSIQNPGAQGSVLLPVPADVKLAGNKSAAEATGKVQGEATGSASVQYGTMANTVDEIDRDIDRMRSHPGLSGITGVRGVIPDMPGSNAADARAQLQKLEGGVFLSARQALKGGGQITDYEGAKAEQAYGRMQTAQSKEAFLQALDDYQEHIHRGLQLLEAQSKGQFGAPPSAATPSPVAPGISVAPARPPLSSFGGK